MTVTNPAGQGLQTDKPGKSVWRRFALELAVGAVLGFLAWSLSGPTIISWWYEPPSRDAFSCAGSVRIALLQFVKMQLGAAVVGRRVFRKTGA
jgi:hypothetical protein